MKDLVVVAPDSNTEQTLYGLLERHKALQIRRIEYRILVHPERDPGVLQRGASLLAEIDALNAFRYALLIFDREGCGRECSPLPSWSNRYNNSSTRADGKDALQWL